MVRPNMPTSTDERESFHYKIENITEVEQHTLQQIIKLGTKFLGTKMISSTNIHNCGRNLKFVYKNEAP